jgi:hypothetical protein
MKNGKKGEKKVNTVGNKSVKLKKISEKKKEHIINAKIQYIRGALTLICYVISSTKYTAKQKNLINKTKNKQLKRNVKGKKVRLFSKLIYHDKDRDRSTAQMG